MAEYRRLSDEAWSRVLEESLHKLKVLAEHKGISVALPRWEATLCLGLAEKLYNGFQIKFDKSIRRPREWDFERYICLLADIEAIKREHINRSLIRPTDLAACGHLVRRCQKSGKGKYLPQKGVATNAAIKTLQNRLTEARSPKLNPFLSRLWISSDNPQEDYIYLTPMIDAFSNPGY